MKAAVVVRPGVLEIREVPEPALGEYDALCRLEYGATCSGTDLHLTEGSFPWPVAYPTILGHESIGRVTAVGPKVRSYAEGDRITRVGCPALLGAGLASNWGGFAELGIARDWQAMQEDGVQESDWRPYRVNLLVPDFVDSRAATMMITWRETLSYSIRMGIGRGARVLVVGTGGNGFAFAAHARNLGAEAVWMIGNPQRTDVAKAVGVSRVFDYRDDAASKQVQDEVAPGVDCIIDAVGKRGTLDRYLPALCPDGTVGIYGIDELADQVVTPRLAPGSFTYYNGGYDEAETHDMVVGFVREGRLDASCWLDVSSAFCLSSLADALAAVRERKAVKALVNLEC